MVVHERGEGRRRSVEDVLDAVRHVFRQPQTGRHVDDELDPDVRRISALRPQRSAPSQQAERWVADLVLRDLTLSGCVSRPPRPRGGDAEHRRRRVEWGTREPGLVGEHQLLVAGCPTTTTRSSPAYATGRTYRRPDRRPVSSSSSRLPESRRLAGDLSRVRTTGLTTRPRSRPPGVLTAAALKSSSRPAHGSGSEVHPGRAVGPP